MRPSTPRTSWATAAVAVPSSCSAAFSAVTQAGSRSGMIRLTESAGSLGAADIRFAALDLRRCVEGQIGRHTSELQSLMRISYDVFCLKKKTKNYRDT